MCVRCLVGGESWGRARLADMFNDGQVLFCAIVSYRLEGGLEVEFHNDGRSQCARRGGSQPQFVLADG